MPSTNQYPFGPLPRKLILAGRYGKPTRQIKQDKDIPVLVTPVLQNDEERGEGDSTNSRLHRLLGGNK